MTQGERIKHERKHAGMTQATLAKNIGVSREAVSQWEKNSYTEIKHDHLIALCRALGNLNPKWIMHGKGDKYLTAVNEEPAPYLDPDSAKFALEFVSRITPAARQARGEDWFTDMFNRAYKINQNEKTRNLTPDEAWEMFGGG